MPRSASSGPWPRSPKKSSPLRSRSAAHGPRRSTAGPQGPRMSRPVGVKSRTSAAGLESSPPTGKRPPARRPATVFRIQLRLRLRPRATAAVGCPERQQAEHGRFRRFVRQPNAPEGGAAACRPPPPPRGPARRQGSGSDRHRTPVPADVRRLRAHARWVREDHRIGTAAHEEHQQHLRRGRQFHTAQLGGLGSSSRPCSAGRSPSPGSGCVRPRRWAWLTAGWKRSSWRHGDTRRCRTRCRRRRDYQTEGCYGGQARGLESHRIYSRQ